MSQCHVLCTNLVVFSSAPGRTTFAVTPSHNEELTNETLYIIHQHAIDHYNVAIMNTDSSTYTVDPVSLETQGSAQLPGSNNEKVCRCGENKKSANSESSCNSLKCSCLKNKRTCTLKCKCSKCANDKPLNPSSSPSAPAALKTKPRKRRRHDNQLRFQSGYNALLAQGEQPRRGPINDVEKCIVIEIILRSGNGKPTFEEVFRKYNDVINYEHDNSMLTDLGIGELTQKTISHYVKSFFHANGM